MGPSDLAKGQTLLNLSFTCLFKALFKIGQEVTMKSWVFLFVCWGGGSFGGFGAIFFSGRSLSGSEFPLGMFHISWSYQPRSKIFFFHSCTIYYHLRSGEASF